MKIALSGLHSQGKTTLLNIFDNNQIFKDYYKVPSPTRILQSEGFVINESGDEVTQTLIMMQHYKNAAKCGTRAFFDRCTLDGLAYSLFFKEKLKDKKVYSLIVDLFKLTIQSYDVIFYIEPELELQNDNTRSLDRVFFDNVKQNFEDVIAEYKIDVKRVKGTIQERVDFIQKFIII